jgi:L-rhamnose-H+ transport protein
MWYGQFFFYGMGATKMGQYDFASWSIHMASIIIFSNLWGIVLKEWKAVSKKTRFYLWLGIIALILSVVLIGAGNNMAGI